MEMQSLASNWTTTVEFTVQFRVELTYVSSAIVEQSV